MEKRCTWDKGSLWLKDRPCKIYVGQWPIFHGPLILPYIILRHKLFLYIKKWHRPEVFVPLRALALVLMSTHNISFYGELLYLFQCLLTLHAGEPHSLSKIFHFHASNFGSAQNEGNNLNGPNDFVSIFPVRLWFSLLVFSSKHINGGERAWSFSYGNRGLTNLKLIDLTLVWFHVITIRILSDRPAY